MLHLLLTALLASLRASLQSRASLALENLALRQQLAVLASKRPKPRSSVLDRVSWFGLLRFGSRWVDALVLVKPATVVRWHLWRPGTSAGEDPGIPAGSDPPVGA